MRSFGILLAALALAGLCQSAFAQDLAETDILPFGLLYGSPELTEQDDALKARVWSEGGRIHIRFLPDGKSHDISGSLVATRDGILKDTSPVSAALRIRQPRPNRLEFDGRIKETVDGLSVILAGDFQSLIVDIEIDGRRQPALVRIGGENNAPKLLPIEFALGDPRARWLDRFGF